MTKCIPWRGHPRQYQNEAREVLAWALEESVPTFHWMAWSCETDYCLEPTHLHQEAPRKFNYPRGVCVYCGMPAWTKDHLLPEPWTGLAARTFVATVPAFGQCNSLLSDALEPNIIERRKIAHERLRRKSRKILATVDRTDEELDEYGPGLRSVIESAMAEKVQVLERLSWPTDILFDRRALEKTDLPFEYIDRTLAL